MGAFDTIARLLGGGRIPKSARSYIIPINEDDTFATGEIRCFQFWPDSISDSKQTNWQAKEIPGLSGPLYQWTAGGPREISFTAVFARDNEMDSNVLSDIEMSMAEANPSGFSANVVNETRKSGEADLVEANKSSSGDVRNADIPGAVAWLRQFMYPNYRPSNTPVAATDRARPPRKIVLCMPGVRLNHGHDGFSASELPCIMTQCDVTYDAFFPSGTPRLAHVALSFAEIIQVHGTIKPQEASRIGSRGEAYTFNPNSRKI